MGQRVLSFCTTVLMAAVLIVCVFCHRWAVGRGDRPQLAASPCPPLPRRRSSGKARRRRLALALPDVLRCGYPARRRRNPAPQPREARTRAATRNAGKALTRGVKIAAAHGTRPEGADAAPRLGGGTPQRGGAATPGGPSAGRAAPARAEPQAGQRGAAGRSQARPGRRRGRPHSPHRVGAGPRRSTDAATGAGEEQSKAAPQARPAGAWPCFAEGYPRATAGDWQAPQGRRPEPPQAATSRHITPTAAGGRGGRRPSRPGWAGVAARRPLGAGGTRPEGADGSPHQPAGLASPCLAVRSTKPRGRRVGRAGPRPGPFTARPKGRAQTEAAPRPRPGARAEDPRSAPPRGDSAPRGRKRPGHQAGPSAIRAIPGSRS